MNIEVTVQEEDYQSFFKATVERLKESATESPRGLKSKLPAILVGLVLGGGITLARKGFEVPVDLLSVSFGFFLCFVISSYLLTKYLETVFPVRLFRRSAYPVP